MKPFSGLLVFSCVLIPLAAVVSGAVFDLRMSDGSVDFFRQWWPPDTTHLGVAVEESAKTVAIAYLGTIFSAWLAVPLGLVMANPFGLRPWLPLAIRSSITALRTIPELVLALVFIVLCGLGAMPAILTLCVHNLAVMTKLFSEKFEACDERPSEAILITGSNVFVTHLFVKVRQLEPILLSDYFYRLEVGIRTSLLLGVVGGGGVGQLLVNHFKSFQYRLVVVDVAVICVLIVVLEVAGICIRRAVR